MPRCPDAGPRGDEHVASRAELEAKPESELRQPTRLLVISGDRFERDRLAVLISDDRLELRPAASAQHARDLLAAGEFHGALISPMLPDACGFELCKALCENSHGFTGIILTQQPTTEQAMRAMQCHAADLMPTTETIEEMNRRVRAALARSAKARELEHRVEHLTHMCRKIDGVRSDVTQQVGSLCDDLVNAYQEMSDTMARVTIASEFNSLIRQELDIESLLRTALEFVLARLGATNAAVFLPATTGDYNLGAYVNYSCPKDSAEMMLDHLAGAIPAAFEDADGLVRMTSDQDLEQRLGDDAHWLLDQDVVVFTSRSEGETLAVLALFRDRTTPFDAEAMELLEVVSDLFARQLARVIQIHHRHLPKDQWGVFETDDGLDDFGPEGFGPEEFGPDQFGSDDYGLAA